MIHFEDVGHQISVHLAVYIYAKSWWCSFQRKKRGTDICVFCGPEFQNSFVLKRYSRSTKLFPLFLRSKCDHFFFFLSGDQSAFKVASSWTTFQIKPRMWQSRTRWIIWEGVPSTVFSAKLLVPDLKPSSPGGWIKLNSILSWDQSEYHQLWEENWPVPLSLTLLSLRIQARPCIARQPIPKSTGGSWMTPGSWMFNVSS